ncbi:MAG: TonB-dependent receptor [Rhodospirillaceae bacterium]|nr:TonB-dependent receptor [Rhodospirillaceae bacterium]
MSGVEDANRADAARPRRVAGKGTAFRKPILAAALLAILAGGIPVGGAGAQDIGAGAMVEVDIAPQALDSALTALADQAGVQILFASGDVGDLRAPSVAGRYSLAQAFDLLLAGTGFTYEFTGERTVALKKLPAQSSGPAVLGPIAVYGAKNVTTLEDTTASVGVVTAEEVEKRELRSFRDAFRTLGNVMDADWPDAGFIIRGVNSEGLTPGGAPLASLYIDGAPQTVNGARRGARGLWDVEQLEVYRGPQSTLTGRAALAGAVYVKTRDPVFDQEAAVQGTFGSMNSKGGAFMVNTPVIEDQVAFRLAGEYEISENDIHYPTYERFSRFEEFVEDEYYQLRGKVLVMPKAMPDTSALLTYSFSHDSPYIDDIGGPVLGFDYSQHRGDFNVPVFSESRSTDTQNVSFEIVHDLNPAITLTSLTTYSFNDMDRSSVNEGTPGETNFLSGYVEQYIATQEIRANYDSGRWSGVAGVYVAQEESDGNFIRPNFFGFASDISRNQQKLFNAALFGEASYEFVPGWQIVAGGRVDHFDQESSNFFSRNGVATTDESTASNELVLLPKIGVITRLAPSQTVGFTVQKGFRNGGSAVQISTGRAFTFDPEYIWNYELSYKGSFLADRLQINANVFYATWKDQQVEVQEDPTDLTSDIVRNAASSTLKGFEFESRYDVTRDFSTFVSLGYVDTEFDEFVDATLGDLSGLPFPEAARWNLAFGGFYQSRSGLFVGADAKYVSRYLARFGNDPQEFLDGYWVGNLQFGYRQDDFDFTVFAENVFDNEYLVYNDRNTVGDIAASLGARRKVGVSINKHF